MARTRTTYNARDLLVQYTEDVNFHRPRLESINGVTFSDPLHIEQVTTRDIEVSDTRWIELAVWFRHSMIGITLHPADDFVTVSFEQE